MFVYMAGGCLVVLGLFWAQIQRIYPPVVWKAGDTLMNAWVGGLHAPQFSTIDLDGDGQEELFVFDRMDDRLLVFQRLPGGWTYQPNLRLLFPYQHLGCWVLLRDYDGDGDKDLFTSVGSNVRVYQNVSPAGAPPIWRLAYDTLWSVYYGFPTYLYSGQVDMPGLADIDGDGDMDFLVYEVLGTLMEWHANQAKELYGRVDTLVPVLKSSCWGHVYETYDSQTNTFTFMPYTCGPGQKHQRIQHSGGSILPINLNGDSLMDVIVGDFGPPYLIGGYNVGTRDSAHVDPALAVAPYPAFAPAVMPGFPATYYEDVTGDGKPDLLVANNDGLAGLDRNPVILYPNGGRVDSPSWAAPIHGWLASTMLDIGTGAHPTLADLNRDGYPDLILTSRQTYTDSVPKALAWLFWGSSGGFLLADSNWLDLPAYSGLVNPVFAVGDIDGNNRLDLIMGVSSGVLWRWEETAPQSLHFALVSSSFLSGPLEASPLLYDVDQDGDLDLLVGARNGRLSLYANQSGQFSLVTDFLGQIELRDTVSTFLGFSRPALADIDRDGNPELIVGNVTGFLRVYRPLWTQASSAWPWLYDLESYGPGSFTSPTSWTFADSTWLLVGLRRGGVVAYRLGGATASKPFAWSFLPYELSREAQGWLLVAREPLCARLYNNMLGQLVWESSLSVGKALLPLSPMRGLYFLQVYGRFGLKTHTLLEP